jgi:hypothetical protein
MLKLGWPHRKWILDSGIGLLDFQSLVCRFDDLIGNNKERLEEYLSTVDADTTSSVTAVVQMQKACCTHMACCRLANDCYVRHTLFTYRS